MIKTKNYEKHFTNTFQVLSLTTKGQVVDMRYVDKCWLSRKFNKYLPFRSIHDSSLMFSEFSDQQKFIT